MKVIRTSQVEKEQTTVPSLFTGMVTTQPVIGKELSKNISIAQVNFGSGVRNKFHKHSTEQILIVTEGKGIVATEEEEIAVSIGDIIYIPAGEKHWHGAAQGATFSHLYVTPPVSKMTQLED